MLAAGLLLGACSGGSGAGGTGGAAPGSGGATGSGGAPGAGGATGAAGSSESGGATGSGGGATGGTAGLGGASGQGGSTGQGGTTGAGGTGTGGKGGATGAGGAAGAGGKGGTTGSGGAAGAGGKGGATGSGGAAGAAAKGGATGTGGATVDGGAACGYQPPSELIYARWPMPNPASAGLPNPASYTDNGDGTVTDNVTKLVWQKSVTSSQAFNWCDAINYCATLTLAGRTWHLPTRIELLSLVDFTRANPALNTTAFPGTPGGKYTWTSSPWVVSQIATKPQDSWIVNFSEGLTSNAGARTALEYARCVSANEGPLPSPRYTAVATGEVQDVDTGLIWATATNAASTTTTDFATAQTICSGLGLNGHTWRTPSIKELSTLVDEVPPISKVSPAIDTTTFAGTAATTPYWSSTLFEGMSAATQAPWVINYEDGFTEYNQTAALVRCVR
ncbi:MAG TPA: DUF1566 domain-containing protein [Polyangia bacterium]|nr:DUF1566 domain-containing protein [Polyangia bacterium]